MERWDEWPQVNAELQRACETDRGEDKRVRVVLFADSWGPFAAAMMGICSRARNAAAIPVFIVDSTKYYNVALELGVVIAPALVFFAHGRPVRIKRAGWEPDTKYVGICSEDTLLRLLETAQSQVTSKGCLECS